MTRQLKEQETEEVSYLATTQRFCLPFANGHVSACSFLNHSGNPVSVTNSLIKASTDEMTSGTCVCGFDCVDKRSFEIKMRTVSFFAPSQGSRNSALAGSTLI
ncbi:hypothetical protein KQX54_015011 [Cotesia glomerata]|uniref:SET domain-containing protein n=1 Tax=Cotesia glomerata TaxID=32391 RepID=A0AAV7IVY7_COTGL|nr:hypothetical protein KQX54_015011 [Cotesia glomerata]